MFIVSYQSIKVDSSKALLLLILLAKALLLVACSQPAEPLAPAVSAPEPQLVKLKGQIFGTTWLVSYVEPEPAPMSSEQLQNAISLRLNEIDALMSTWKTDSELSLLNASETGVWYGLSQQLLDMLVLAREISLQTGGAFDITVGPLVNLWGFGPNGKVEQVPPQLFIDAARTRVGIDKFSLDIDNRRIMKSADIYLDLSAIAKGHAVDAVSDLLADRGISNHLVEIGGEVKVMGSKIDAQPWQIGLESPSIDSPTLQRVVQIKDISVATSGDYRNYFAEDGVRYSHIIDPVSGRPIEHHLASVTVLHADSANADALATALFVMGPERALDFAERNELAVFMLVKQGDSFVESYSSAFQRYL